MQRLPLDRSLLEDGDALGTGKCPVAPVVDGQNVEAAVLLVVQPAATKM